MKPLVNNAFNLPFRRYERVSAEICSRTDYSACRPEATAIRSRLLSIAFKYASLNLRLCLSRV